MTNPVDQFKKMAAEDIAPYRTRSCASCRNAPENPGYCFARCKATGSLIEHERFYPSHTCGPAGKLWEPIPPRLGLFGWIRRLLFGDRK